MNVMTDHSQLFIGGEWVAPSSQGRIEVISPWTEQVIASVPSAAKEDVDRAVAAARAALKSGPWAEMTLDERIAIVERLRDLIVEHSEELAQVTTAEMGCPISQSRAIQVPNPVGILQAYVDTVRTYPFEEVRQSANGQALVLREPVGVVAGVVPWNVPLSLTVQKLIPALLTGCTIVLKPSPETPLDSYVLAHLLQDAGCPPGVVSILPADREVSEYLISHPGVNKVTFTGSSAAGRRIAEICGKDLRRVTLELGGKSAAVVLDDADLGTVAEALRMGAFRNNGQICTLKTRILVPAKRRDDLIDHLNAMLDTMPIGDPGDATTQIGPLVTARQRSVVEGFIKSGIADGGKIVRGGGRPDFDHGWFVEPTVFVDVDQEATIAQREIFGPVVSVMSYESEDEAIAMANDSTYGLSGAVFSSDPMRGVKVARQLETGAVEVNGKPAGFLAPMGGVKYSGLGREFGREGIDPFIEFKSIGISAETAASLG